MSRSRNVRRKLLAVLSMTLCPLIVSWNPTTATAACVGTQSITSCTQTCTANCWLNSDLNCTDGQGLTINASNNLDMCGHKITCTSTTCFQKPAITMAGNSSKVFNSLTGANYQEAAIVGLWGYGIDCALKTSSQVIGIRFEDVSGAIHNCAKIQNNVVDGAGGSPAIYSDGVANSDIISDNYIAGPVGGIGFYGGENITISNNTIANTSSNNSTAIDIGSSDGSVTISGNIIIGSYGTPIVGNAFASYSNNVCDPNNTSGCGYCQTNDMCVTPRAPFTTP